MATPNPLEGAKNPSGHVVSSQTHIIAGIFVTVYGLGESPTSASSIACLWLLHPRLQAREYMEPIANQVIVAWNHRRQQSQITNGNKGLIAVTFDQRNHGSRQIDKLHNEAWKQGNPRHAQDMFSCYHGTATDASHLMDHLESYIFASSNSARITQHLVLGISLGGHAAWHCLLSDSRFTAGVVGIGCPDYTRVMTDRARLSKLATYNETSPPGARFLGSPDFPKALQDAVAKYDPAGLFLPGYFNPIGPDPSLDETALKRFRTLLKERLLGKQILNLSGAVDKLVPYAAGEPFFKVLKKSLAEDPDLNVKFEDVLFDGVGHAWPKEMGEKATHWLCEVLAGEEGIALSKI